MLQLSKRSVALTSLNSNSWPFTSKFCARFVLKSNAKCTICAATPFEIYYKMFEEGKEAIWGVKLIFGWATLPASPIDVPWYISKGVAAQNVDFAAFFNTKQSQNTEVNLDRKFKWGGGQFNGPQSENFSKMYHELHTIPLPNYRKIHYRSSTKYYFEFNHNFCCSYKHPLQFSWNFKKFAAVSQLLCV